MPETQAESKQSNTKVGIIGRGNVGFALQRRLANAGYDVQVAGKEPEVQE